MEGRVDGGGTAHVAHFATSPELGKSHPTRRLVGAWPPMTLGFSWYWSAVFVLVIAALSALYARRGHSTPEPLPTVMPTLLTDHALSATARRRARRPAAETPVAAPDTSDGSSESDSNDDGLQSLLQMRSPARRVAEPSMRMRSPTQLTQSAASDKSEPSEAGWDAAATPRKRAARAASSDPAAASCRTEPSALPAAGGTADASDDQLEDWGELYSAHSKVRCAPGSTRYPQHPIRRAPCFFCRYAGCLSQAQGQAQQQRAHSHAAPVLH